MRPRLAMKSVSHNPPKAAVWVRGYPVCYNLSCSLAILQGHGAAMSLTPEIVQQALKSQGYETAPHECDFRKPTHMRSVWFGKPHLWGAAKYPGGLGPR